MTRRGMILGTAAYMSPEQAKGRAADKRSDVWAFGCVLFEMLTGARAFDGEDVADTLAAVLRARTGLDGPARGADPAGDSAADHRCLVKDRRLRIADISVARFAMTEAANMTPATAALASPPSSRAQGDCFLLLRPPS